MFENYYNNTGFPDKFDHISDPYRALRNIKEAIIQDQEIIYLDYNFILTKGEMGRSTGFIYRDKNLEELSRRWIEEKINVRELLDRYRGFDNTINFTEWPKSFAIRLLDVEGPLASGDNIFIFFPGGLGLQTEKREDVFSFEFVDMWKVVLEKIVFPCIKKALTIDNQFFFYKALNNNLEKIAYIASAFHEIGHWVGPWKIYPTRNPQLLINEYLFAVLTELSADIMQAIVFANEFPEIGYFLLLQRIFWPGRKRFSKNPLYASVNYDYDAWLSLYLWEKAIETNCIKKTRHLRWHIESSYILNTFQEILTDINRLAASICLKRDKETQEELVYSWVSRYVNHDQNKQFRLPTYLIDVYNLCRSIPEFPEYNRIINFEKNI